MTLSRNLGRDDSQPFFCTASSQEPFTEDSQPAFEVNCCSTEETGCSQQYQRQETVPRQHSLNGKPGETDDR